MCMKIAKMVMVAAAASTGKKRSHAAMQSPASLPLGELGMNELLPGRNVILDAGGKDDLAFQVSSNHWCW